MAVIDDALRYAAIGWHVFPCKPDKKPFTEHGFHDAGTDPDTIRAWWERWPNAHIGVACGASGLAVIDCDYDPSKAKNGIAAFDRLCDDYGLHGCGLEAQTPRGGRHYVFLHPGGHVTTCNNLLPGSGIDVRGDGGYFLVPSEASPGRAWIVGDPFEVNGDGTTDLAPMPAWLVAIVRKALDHGASEGADSRGMPLDDARVASIRAALQHVDPDPHDDWIHVGMALKSTGAGEQAFQLWCEWAAESPKFDERTHRRRWKSIREFRWNGSEITLGTLFWMAKAGGWMPSADEELLADEPGEVFVEDVTDEDPFPGELLNIPGVLGDLCHWMIDSSPRPQPAICLASAIATIGAVLGRRVSTETDLRTNVYTIGVGETGCGKEMSIKAPFKALEEAGLAKFAGPGGWKSDSGLRAALLEQPSQCSYQDEFGKVLRMLGGQRVPPHIEGIKKNLLELFGRANAVVQGDGYADRKQNPATPINEPNLCFYGASTPQDLFDAMNSGAVRDGFLNRFLFFFSDDPLPTWREAGKVMPTKRVVDGLKELDAATKPQGSLQGSSSSSAVATGCRIVCMTEAAAARMHAIRNENDSRIRALREGGSGWAELWNRFAEHVAKLALIRSVSDDPKADIGTESVEWAYRLVYWCLMRTQAVAEQRMADSAIEAATKRVERLIASAKLQGISSSELTRSTRWLRGAERKDILSTLIQGGQAVQVQEGSTGGRPAVRFYGARFAPGRFQAS